MARIRQGQIMARIRQSRSDSDSGRGKGKDLLLEESVDLGIVPGNESGTYTTVKTRFWPWLAGKIPKTLPSDSIFSLGNGKGRTCLGLVFKAHRLCITQL